MNTSTLSEALDYAIPDDKIVMDLRDILQKGIEGATTSIELNGKWAPVPVSVPITVVTKAFFVERFDTGFGAYKVLAALGAVKQVSSLWLEAEYCFSTLYYNHDMELITLDFHVDMS